MAGGIINTDKRVGSAENRRHYDLPLNQDKSTLFLGVLIALMAFLATIALTFSFSINQVMDGWTSGLEHKITIEIPAEDSSGSMRSADAINALQDKIVTALAGKPYILSTERVADASLAEMIKPWLGDVSDFSNIPLPGLISVELVPEADDALSRLTAAVAEVTPDANIDAHESWLADLSRLTGSMQVAILFIVSVIALTSVAAVAGAIQSQVEINRPDVELLHLMGARDSYITRQFLRHAALISFLGALAGVVAGLVLIGLISVVFGYKDYVLLPRLNLGQAQLLSFAALPFVLCLISSLSARQTVLRVLREMP